MNAREKKLMYATIAAVGIFGVWQFGVADAVEGGDTASSGIPRLEREFHDNLRALEDMYVVERDFRLVAVPPGDERSQGFTPALAFQQEVFDIANSLGFSFPDRLAAEMENIDGVDEYVLLSVALRTDGTYEDVVNLLKRFEQEGMIFRDLELTSTRDRDPVGVRVTVARITERPAGRSRMVSRQR